jgi:hypothetical protein
LDTYSTAFAATNSLGPRLSLDLGINQSFQYVGRSAATGALANSKVWSTMDWLNYEFVPGLSAGLGLGGGYADLSVGASIPDEQAQGRVIWHATDKLGLTVSGGIEEQQFVDPSQRPLLNPVFSAVAIYKPFEDTMLTVGATRVVSPSLLEGLVSEDTVVSGQVRQRFLKKLALDISAGYGATSYEVSSITAGGANQPRTDDYTFVNVRLSVLFLKRGTAGVFYQNNRNSSTSTQYQFTSTQVGFDISYRY